MNLQASIVFGARRRAASAWLAEETYFLEITPLVIVLKAVCFTIQPLKIEGIFILSITK